MSDAVHGSQKNHRALLVMLGTLLLVIISATILHRMAARGVIDLPALLGTSNRGTLVSPPLALTELEMRVELAGVPDYTALPPMWSLLVVIDGACDDACRQHLYQTRQVRIALGKETNRVRRLLLVGAERIELGLREWLQREHDDLLILHAPADQVARLRAEVGGVVQPAYFIVDPQGWLMMAYSSWQDPRDLLTDMKFLLKYSNG